MFSGKKIILLDMDDTVNDFTGMFWQTHNSLHNTEILSSSVNDWNLSKFSPLGDKVYDLFKHPGLFRNLEPKENAADVIKRLDEKYDVYFVTDSPAGTSHCEIDTLSFSNPTDDKRKWLKDHFPFFDSNKLVVTGHKWMVYGDVLVDDKPGTFSIFEKLGRDIVLMDAPYNQDIKTKYRAFNLEQVEEMIHDILKNK
jgi:5'(3')-deoxyribonucleotidase